MTQHVPIEELLDGCEEVDESKRDTSTKMSTAVEKALGRTIAKRQPQTSYPTLVRG